VADAPWRCSQCGTVNEPVANACRTCGRWPSLFDLESSKVEADAPMSYDDADEFAAQTVEVEYAEPEVYEPAAPTPAIMEAEVDPDVEPDFDDVDEQAQPKPLWRRLSSLIIPIAVIVYIVISALVNNDAG
jgi:hypothetical protein